jgi:hypothetical protein
MSSLTDIQSKIDESLKKIQLEQKNLNSLIKELFKLNKVKNKKTKDNTENKVKKSGGITEKRILPPNVNEFIKYALSNNKLSDNFVKDNQEIFENFSSETLVARTKVFSIINNYIKTNNLYKNDGTRVKFLPDDKLKNLFEIKDSKELNLNNLQSFIKIPYDKYKNSKVLNNSDNEEMENDSSSSSEELESEEKDDDE